MYEAKIGLRGWGEGGGGVGGVDVEEAGVFVYRKPFMIIVDGHDQFC